MNEKLLLICLVLITPLICISQETYEYLGGLVLNDTISYTYKLNITEHEGNIKGYSISDIGGIQETKSIVFGEYNKSKKELNLRETQTVYTKTPLEKDYEFCYVNTTIKNFSFEKTKKVKTNFIGLFEDNVQCINGELYLSLAEKIEERMAKVAKKINKMKRLPDSVKQKFQPLKMMDSMNMNILRKNQTLSIFTNDEKIKLIVYDGGKEDGDRISIMSNGKTIRKSYKATNKRNIILLNLDSKKTSIVIKAENEGQISPNTVVVELVDQENNIRALSNLKVGEETRIDVLKK